jgi:hypothetical protein
MPAPFVIAGWLVEHGGQFMPAGLIARFDPHDVTCARYVDIFAVRPQARQGYLYFNGLTRLNAARCRET